MAEPVAAVAETGKNIVLAPIRTPVLFLGIGLFFTILLIIVEARKPGLVTNPVRRFLGKVGLLPTPAKTA